MILIKLSNAFKDIITFISETKFIRGLMYVLFIWLLLNKNHAYAHGGTTCCTHLSLPQRSVDVLPYLKKTSIH